MTYFESVVPRAEAVAGCLSRLLPNLGWPLLSVRRLYAWVVLSVLLYGAPVWHAALSAPRPIKRFVDSVHRRVCLHVVWEYRTISGVAAAVLSGIPPVNLLVKAPAEAYGFLRRTIEAWSDSPSRVAVSRRTLWSAVKVWQQRLSDAEFNRWTVEAIRLVFASWANGVLSYRMSQVLLGYGCFGAYLHLIRREPTARCHHCGEREDSVWHTLLIVQPG